MRGRLCGTVSLQPASPLVLLVSALRPFAGSSGCQRHYVCPRLGVGWVCATSLPLSSPSLLPASLGAHLIPSKAVLGKVLAWSGAEQSFNSNPPSGGRHGDREEAPRAGKGLQGMTQAGQVQYSCPSLCADPSVALGVGFESELSSRGGSAVSSRGCVMLLLALLVVHSKKAGHILGQLCAKACPQPGTHFASSSADLISKGTGISQKH